MSDRVEPAYEGKSAVNAIKTESGQGASQFQDNRPEAANLMQLQAMANGSDQVQHTGQLQASANENKQASVVQPKKNNTGLPDNLKSGIENLSGMSMDDVKVHRNSDKPAQLNAHAYAQGTDIHLASGQEKHLPHEAWHVVQQKQGRVKPTKQVNGSVNDIFGLAKAVLVFQVFYQKFGVIFTTFRSALSYLPSMKVDLQRRRKKPLLT